MDEAISVASTTPTAARTATLGRHLRRLEFGDDGRRHEREPTATLSTNGPISEGSSATISFSNQSDPSSVDT
ncbi:MAG TPA: hypothetical protein VI006_21875, partial [Solirubrobacteraceae bacterium]